MTDTRSTPPVEDFRVGLAKSALQFGAVTGGLGYLAGGTAGIIRGSPSFLFAAASSLQTFALGSTFSATRSLILRAQDTGPPSPRDLNVASSAAGGISGAAIALITRGRSNVIPATLMWSLFGCLGQLSVNAFVAPRDGDGKGLWRRFTETKWSPVSYVSNEDYIKILRERMLKIDVEIAVLDDKIVALREQLQKDSKTEDVVGRDNIEGKKSSPTT